MTVVKTAISLEKPLFEKLDQLAGELKIPRSRLLAVALEEYIKRYENLILLQDLNAAYGDEQEDELELSVRHASQFRRNLEESW
jgi:metal-responsive CopG/Arc/MetJ family transcriptional regulator